MAPTTPPRLRRPLAALALAMTMSGLGCTSRFDEAGPDRLAPAPVRTAGVALVGAGAVLHLYGDDGAPAVRPIAARRAFRDGTVTWIGHAGFLIRLAGRSLLIDPMLSERLGFLLPLGPRRITAPPDLSGLDRLDAVAISHIDHDHFDEATLLGLAQRFPRARLVVPKGMGGSADRLGFAATIAAEVGRPVDLGGLRLTATPGHHFGRRDVVGLMRTPAVGWVVEGGGRRVFHAGDTGHGPAFRGIGERHGPIDLALVPIGAYEPEALFRDMHASPEDAVAIARDVRARRAIGHHWGTFALGPERPAEAVGRFVAAGRGTIDARVLAVGETVAIGR